MGETTAIVIKPQIVKVRHGNNKYQEVYDTLDALDIVLKSSDDGWAHIKFMTRHDGLLLQSNLHQRKSGIQTNNDGTRWKLQTRLHYPFADRRTIFSFRKVLVND